MACLTELCPECSDICSSTGDDAQTDGTIIVFYTCVCGCEFEREHPPDELRVTKKGEAEDDD